MHHVCINIGQYNRRIADWRTDVSSVRQKTTLQTKIVEIFLTLARAARVKYQPVMRISLCLQNIAS